MLKRRIKSAKIDFLSLVPKGANGQPVLYKEDNGNVELRTLMKELAAFDEKGEVLCVGYVPEYRDSQGDIASIRVCEEMAHSFMEQGANLDIRHNGKKLSKEQVFVAENFVIQAKDPRFQDWKDVNGKPVNCTGAWGALLKIKDPEVRKLYREGAWNGVSLMASNAVLEIEKAQEEVTMTPEELKAALAANNEALSKTLVEGLTKALKPAEPKPEEKKTEDKVIFKGDPLDAKAVKAHLAAVKKSALLKSVNFEDEASVAAYLAKLEEDTKSEQQNETPDEKIARIEKENLLLRTQLQKGQRASSLPLGTPALQSAPEGMEADAYASGKSMAALVNKRRGITAN